MISVTPSLLMVVYMLIVVCIFFTLTRLAILNSSDYSAVICILVTIWVAQALFGFNFFVFTELYLGVEDVGSKINNPDYYVSQGKAEKSFKEELESAGFRTSSIPKSMRTPFVMYDVSDSTEEWNEIGIVKMSSGKYRVYIEHKAEEK